MTISRLVKRVAVYLLIPICIQAGTFVGCAAWLLTVLFVLPRRYSPAFSVSTWMET